MSLDRRWAEAAQRFHPPNTVPWDSEPRLAIVTVNFSTTHWLKLMLLTLVEQENLDLVSRIVIVDNASRDGGPAFLGHLDSAIPLVHVLPRRHRLHHGPAMRAGVRSLNVTEAQEAKPANVILFCDADVIFRAPHALATVAASFLLGDVGLVGEARRHGGPTPDIQASFIAVRRDVYSRRDIRPPSHDGAPTRRLQRSIVSAGYEVVDVPSNRGGLVLHRGRSGVGAAATFRPLHQYATAPRREAHYMGVPGGETIWKAAEERYRHLLERGTEEELVGHLADALGSRT